MRISQNTILYLFKIYATFSVAFLLSYAISGVVSPISNSSAVTCVNGMISGTDDVCSNDTTDVNVSIEGAWTVAVSSSGTLNVDVTPKGSGTTSTTTDNVNIYTNTPNGYQLYLNSTTGSTDIYNNSDTEHERNHFIATTGTKDSPITLSSNSWGYSLSSNPTTFSKVETSSSAVDALISTGSKTSGSGDNLGVTYGFKADTKLTPGTYTTSVTYTAVAEVPSYTIQGVSPNSLTLDQAAQDITIVTTTPATELGLGDVTAKITNSSLGVDLSLTNCSETIVEISGTNYRAARCAYPGGTVEQGGLPVGTYNIELTSTWHSATYTKANAITVTSNYSITSVTPDVGNNNATTTITMATNAEAANSTAFGTVIGTIGSTAMTDCSETTSGDYRAVQCTIPSGVTAGTYAVSFTAAGHSNTNYTKASAVTIRAYLTVSGGSGSGWYAPNTTVNIAANTCGTNMEFWQWTTTGGTIVSSTSPSTTITTTTSNITVTRNCSMTCASIASGGVGIVNGYNVKKLADGKCWQTSTYTYATWEDRGSCPNGFAFPSKSNFELLVSKYSGGGLYADWGLSATTYLWSSTEYDNTTAYRLLINSNAADILSSNKTNRFAVRCYAQ